MHLPSAMCVVHPQENAAGTCQRCGRFGCHRCLGPSGACPECRGYLASQPRSDRAVAALSLGLLSITCTCLPGLAAILLGWLELRRIARGSASPAGRPWALGAVALGLTSLVTNGLLVLALWLISLTE